MESLREAPLTGSIRLVRPFLEVASQDKTSADDWLRKQLGFSDAELSDPDGRVSLGVVASMLSDAVARTGERDLGLRAAVALDAALAEGLDAGPREFVTLRAVMDHAREALPRWADGLRWNFQVRGELAYLQLQLPATLPVPPVGYEFAIAMALMYARRATGDGSLAPREVRFTHEAPADRSLLDELFRCPVVFEADATEIVIETRTLDARLPDSRPSEVRELLEARAPQVTALSNGREGGGYAEQVLALADCELRTISADHISGRLGVSERTLHRRLAAEGTSYRELIERARKTAALRYLEQPRSLGQVADLLGYASTQSFQRAFRRWTGTSPGSYQRQHARRTG